MSNYVMGAYSPAVLNYVASLAPQIEVAAARYGVPPEAIAGAIAEEQTSQSTFLGSIKYDISVLRITCITVTLY